MIIQVRRWWPTRRLVVVAGRSYAAIELLAACAGLPQAVTMVTRLRLDAALYNPPPARWPSTRGAPRKKGARQPPLAQRVDARDTTWEAVTIAWYARSTRLVKLAIGTAV